MHLTIDIGNTKIKTGFFDKNKLIKIWCYDYSTNDIINTFIKENNINSVIISSVKAIDKKILSLIQDIPTKIEFNGKTPIPVKNFYKTPETLGNDRLACAVAGASLFPEQNILIIDCGTCIKYDFVNKNKEYLGGAISPGINIRFQSLHNFTAQLPLIKAKIPDNITGRTTEESILSGVMNGALLEIESVIEYYKSNHNDLKVIITGGDSQYFVNRLKNRIFAVENLILTGLNIILEYNVKKK